MKPNELTAASLPRMNLFGHTIPRLIAPAPATAGGRVNAMWMEYVAPDPEENHLPSLPDECEHKWVRDSFVRSAIRCTKCDERRAS